MPRMHAGAIVAGEELHASMRPRLRCLGCLREQVREAVGMPSLQ